MSRAKIRRKVHDPRTCVPRARDPLSRRAVWERAENDLRFLERCIVGCDERDRSRRQREVVAASLIGGSKHQIEARVVGEERTKLPPGVTACAEYADRNSMHEEC